MAGMAVAPGAGTRVGLLIWVPVSWDVLDWVLVACGPVVWELNVWVSPEDWELDVCELKTWALDAGVLFGWGLLDLGLYFSLVLC